MTLLERFEKKYIPEPNSGCWLWLGAAQTRGYGQMRIAGHIRSAPAISHELFKGVIPAGEEIDHLCRNPYCVNPDHLEAVTHKENVCRGRSPNAIIVRDRKCKQGHDFSGANVYIWRGYRACLLCRNRRNDERFSCE
jgi:hypothetical protein